tara:strand:+ start:1693 stop:2424 length:732 start_codon:yes stop_codon:yes gene_type:complete
VRTGVIAQKIGMTQIYDDSGSRVPVTVLHIDACQVVAQRTQAHNGYDAVQVGAGRVKIKNVSKAQRGLFAQAQVEPKARLAEFRVSSDAILDVGAEISANHFSTGQKVDVCATSIGKGFAGPMKRHGFGGLEATHGVSVSHRSHGSTGNSQEPGRVWKGKKMAGHLGNQRKTIQNLTVISTDADRGLLLVKGAVPGAKGSWVKVSDAGKRPVPEDSPYPAGLKTSDGGESGASDSSASEDTQG